MSSASIECIYDSFTSTANDSSRSSCHTNSAESYSVSITPSDETRISKFSNKDKVDSTNHSVLDNVRVNYRKTTNCTL